MKKLGNKEHTRLPQVVASLIFGEGTNIPNKRQNSTSVGSVRLLIGSALLAICLEAPAASQL